MPRVMHLTEESAKARGPAPLECYRYGHGGRNLNYSKDSDG